MTLRHWRIVHWSGQSFSASKSYTSTNCCREDANLPCPTTFQKKKTFSSPVSFSDKFSEPMQHILNKFSFCKEHFCIQERKHFTAKTTVCFQFTAKDLEKKSWKPCKYGQKKWRQVNVAREEALHLHHIEKQFFF